GRARDGVEESAVVTSGLPPPSLQDRAGGERQMVIAIPRGSGLLRGNSARGDDERPPLGETHRSLLPDGTEGELRELAASAAEERRLIFAACERSDAAISDQRAEGRAVLDASQKLREPFRAADRGSKFPVREEILRARERDEEADHQSARAR